MKLFFSVAVLLVLLGAAVNVASADPVMWTVSTLTFDSGSGLAIAAGGTASGFFTYDADTNTYSDWNIDVSGFGAGFNQGNAVATPATSTVQFPTPNLFELSYSSDQAVFDLFFPLALTDSGGNVELFADVLDAGNYLYSWHAHGTASAVPEPASAVLLLAGISTCVLCVFLHQRRLATKGVASSKNPPL